MLTTCSGSNGNSCNSESNNTALSSNIFKVNTTLTIYFFGEFYIDKIRNSINNNTRERCIYRGRLSVVDVLRLQTEAGQITPTSPSAPSHTAWSSAPWGLLRCPRERSNVTLNGERICSDTHAEAVQV